MTKLTAGELEEAIKYLGMDRYTEEEWQTIYNTANQLKDEREEDKGEQE